MPTNHDTELETLTKKLVEDFYLSDVLDALARRAASEARKEPKAAECWKRARAMILKAAAVVEDVGL